MRCGCGWTRLARLQKRRHHTEGGHQDILSGNAEKGQCFALFDFLVAVNPSAMSLTATNLCLFATNRSFLTI